MIGRGAQGQPWLPGQIGRQLAGADAEDAPPLQEQLGYVTALYEEILSHYGTRIGGRHARKHLGWALDVAAQGVVASAEFLKRWRHRVLTSEQPSEVRSLLVEAYDDLAWRAA